MVMLIGTEIKTNNWMSMHMFQVQSLQNLLNGPDVFVAVGNDQFKVMSGFETNRSSRTTVLHTSRLQPADNIVSRLKDKRDRLSKTSGCHDNNCRIKM